MCFIFCSRMVLWIYAMINGSNTPVRERDTWRTPPKLFEWAAKRYLFFDIDLAANAQNHLCPVWYGDGGRGDAFAEKWSDIFPARRGWCNPPYSKIAPWVDKAVSEAADGFETVMLIPAPNGEKYTQKLFQHAVSITWIIGRVGFVDSTGKIINGNPRGSVLVEFGVKNPAIKAELYWVDKRVWETSGT
jgi:phage N-6-adenine-methyltransferase